jgi:DNA-binding NarL/FixJ family response regulator
LPDHAPKYALTLDPNRFFRSGIDSCLVKVGHEVLCHAHGLPEVVRVVGSRTPDLAAVGPNFTEPEAFATCREMLVRWPSIQILLYTGHAADPLVQADAFHTGIRAVMSREGGNAETLAAIARIEAELPMFTQEIRDSRPATLSLREMDVLKLMAEGKTDKGIAHDLNVSYATARNYAQRILEKLDLHERRDAVRRGRRLGWVPLKQNG